MPRRLVQAGLVLLLGCGHTDPFATPSNGSDQPFDPAPPVRLTLSAGADRSPTWLPDGSGILYASQELGRSDRDVCLAQLPPGGGQQTMIWCDVPVGAGWTDGLLAPATSPDGRFAYLATSHTVNGLAPEINGLRVAPGLDPFSGTVALRLPYPRAGASIAALSHLRWLGADRLAFVAQSVRHRDLCPPCPQDTLVANVAIELLTLGQAAAVPVPGTEFASGLATLPESGDVLYTLDGDTRIYRRNLASGAVEVVHDFGAAGIARDLHLSGNRLAVVVGGRVGGIVDPVLGPMQWDSGGVIHVLDLAAGTATALEATRRIFRRPALSPAGDRLVAEGYVITTVITTDPGTGQETVDSTFGSGSDLYLFGAAQ